LREKEKIIFSERNYPCKYLCTYVIDKIKIDKIRYFFELKKNKIEMKNKIEILLYK